MPGAVYRNSSSARRERGKSGDSRDSRSRSPEREGHPANTRLASRKEPAGSEASIREGHEHSSPASPLPSRTKAEPATDREGSPRSSAFPAWQVRLTPSGLLMVGILLLITLCFFFLFGLIIGRGSIPPVQPPERERLLPAPHASAEAPEQILPEEDLRFMTNLKTDNPSGTEAPAENSRPDSQPVPQASSGQSPAPSGPGETQLTASPQDNSQYDYVIRAAAFKTEERADDLRAKLEGAGIRTRLIREKGQKGTWYHVHILYRGTPEKMQALRDSLGRYGIRDSLVASRTPVR